MKMNMNIRKAFGGVCIPILALGVFFASCTDELSSEVVPGGGGKGGESEVTLKLQVPGTAAGAKTRAVTPKEENEIDDLYVLAFKVDKDDGQETFDYYVAAKKQSTQSPQGDLSTWTASLKVKDYQQTFVMIANAQGTTRKVNEQISALARNSVGQGKMEMLAKLTETLSEDEKTKGFNADAPGNHRPFTMYGQTASTLITENGGHNLTVSMHRIMAQVRITFIGDAADDTKFEAESVLLYNFNDRARVIPDNLGMTGKDYVKTPTIPQGAVLLPAKVDGKESVPTYAVDKVAKTIEHKIYLFETAQPGDGTELEKHTKRPCLIVKGKYGQDGKSCYYRVDLAKTEPAGGMTYMDVMRNHSYNVTINAVTGRGHDTPQEALQSKPANITATVAAWDDTEIRNLDFDGKHVLGIGTMKFQLNKRGGRDLLQEVKASTGLAWTATLYEVDEYGQATNNSPTWIKFAGANGTETSTISGMGTNELEDWKFNVERNDQVPERRAVMRFTAGNLKVDALVVQDQSNPVYINVKIDGKVITEEEFAQKGGWCREMTIEYGPENTALTWKYSGRGVELSQTSVGTGTTTDTNGTANSGNNEDATLLWKGEAKPLAGVDAQDYATGDGVLTLIAKGPQGMEAKSIRLFQKKYGVTLAQTMVPCNGRVQHIYVKGNMPWKATMKADDLNKIMDNGMLQTAYTFDSGEATDVGSNPFSRLTFDTKQADIKKGLLGATMKFQHPTKPDIGPFEKNIRFAGLLEDGGNSYLVLGPVKRSLNEIAARKKYTYPDGTEDEAAFMTNKYQANMLTNAGIADWEVCSESELIDINFFSYNRVTNLDGIFVQLGHFWKNGKNDEAQIIIDKDNVVVYYCNAKYIDNFNNPNQNDKKYVYAENYGQLNVDLPSAGSAWHEWDRMRLYHTGNNLINIQGGTWGQIQISWHENKTLQNMGTLGGFPPAACGLPTIVRDNVRHEWQLWKVHMYGYKNAYFNLHAGNGYENYSYWVGGEKDNNKLMTQLYNIYYLKPVY